MQAPAVASPSSGTRESRAAPADGSGRRGRRFKSGHPQRSPVETERHQYSTCGCAVRRW
jgi:hypothetical protein